MNRFFTALLSLNELFFYRFHFFVLLIVLTAFATINICIGLGNIENNNTEKVIALTGAPLSDLC